MPIVKLLKLSYLKVALDVVLILFKNLTLKLLHLNFFLHLSRNVPYFWKYLASYRNL